MASEFNIFNEDCLTGMSKIPDGSVDLIITDLPYGITDCAFDRRLPFEPLWEQFHRVTKINAAICLFAAGKFLIELAASNLKEYRYKWVWRKNLGTGFLNAKKMPLRAHEDILVFYRKLPKYNPQFTQGKPYTYGTNTKSPNYQVSRKYRGNVFRNTMLERRYPRDELLFNVPQTEIKTVHAQQKPVALLEYLIRTYSDAGETVLDATMGSGSTGVAAINTGRNFIGFETEEKYFEIAKDRINKAVADNEEIGTISTDTI